MAPQFLQFHFSASSNFCSSDFSTSAAVIPKSPQIMGNNGLRLLSATHSAVDVLPLKPMVSEL